MRFYGKPYCMLDYGLLRLRLAMTRWEMSLRDSTCGIVAIYHFAQSGFRYLSLRGANEMSNFVFHLVIARGISLVAIHNPKSRFRDSIAVINLVQHYRLPRVINHARNDAKAESTYQLPRKFCKLARNDKDEIARL